MALAEKASTSVTTTPRSTQGLSSTGMRSGTAPVSPSGRGDGVWARGYGASPLRRHLDGVRARGGRMPATG